MYDKYDLARRFHDLPKKSINYIEIADVTSVEPLKIKIGNAEYDSTYWEIYEPFYEDKDALIKDGFLGSNESDAFQESTFSFKEGTYKECKSYTKYNVGDKLAVHQMSGDKSFIILCKLRRVQNA